METGNEKKKEENEDNWLRGMRLNRDWKSKPAVNGGRHHSTV